MSDRFNTIAGWALFAGIIALGGGIVSSKYFHDERPEKMGYEVTVLQMVDSTTAQMERDTTFSNDPLVRADILHALGGGVCVRLAAPDRRSERQELVLDAAAPFDVDAPRLLVRAGDLDPVMVHAQRAGLAYDPQRRGQGRPGGVRHAVRAERPVVERQRRADAIDRRQIGPVLR